MRVVLISIWWIKCTYIYYNEFELNFCSPFYKHAQTHSFSVAYVSIHHFDMSLECKFRRKTRFSCSYLQLSRLNSYGKSIHEWFKLVQTPIASIKYSIDIFKKWREAFEREEEGEKGWQTRYKTCDSIHCCYWIAQEQCRMQQQ